MTSKQTVHIDNCWKWEFLNRNIIRKQYFSANAYLYVVNENLDETIGADVLALLVATITDVWHQVLSLVSTSDTVIDTLRISPVWLRQSRSGNLLGFT